VTQAIFVRLLSSDDKGTALAEAVSGLDNGSTVSVVYVADTLSFKQLPGSPLPYWVSDAMRELFQNHPYLEAAADICFGLSTKSDFRFLRCSWEVGSISKSRIDDWPPFAKGGEFSQYYADIHLALNWANDGAELKKFSTELGVQKFGTSTWSRWINNVDYYYRPGLTYSSRSQRGFSVRVMPTGCIFAGKGPGIFETAASEKAYLLGFLNSSLARELLSMQMAFGSYEVGVVQKLPYVTPSQEISYRVSVLALSCHDHQRDDDHGDETTHAFSTSALLLGTGKTLAARMEAAIVRASANAVAVATDSYEIDQLVLDLYEISPKDRAAIEDELKPHSGSYPDDASRRDKARFRQAYLTKEEVADEDEEGDSNEAEPVEGKATRRKTRARYRDLEDLAHLFRVHPAAVARRRAELGLMRPDDGATEVENLLSYCLGVAFGRWDARIGKDPSLGATLGGAFDQLPVCAPGALTEDAALVGKDGPLPYRPERLPAAPEHVPADYPLHGKWSGILVDDDGHSDDLVARVRGVLAYLFGPERAPSIEAEAIVLLQEGGVKVKGLRDYYATRFFGTHIKRYSKSRRKAPIYWQLASRRKSYSLWLYYHRLHPGTLYQALQEYVEPKIELEQTRLRELEAQQRAATDSRAARTLAGQVDKKSALVEELIQFGNDLKEAADRGFAPDLNDGVMLNIAPLHKLVPWPDAATAWKELNAGTYPWSTIGQRLAGTPK